ncbi:MAG: hypothetical protein K0Q75_265 [Anaerospora sp.]|nr:hypothetical protein [Anaerospora sp.]
MAIALVCVVLGVMIAVQFRTTQDIRASIPFQRVEDLSQRLNQTEKERDALLKEVQQLRQASEKETVSREIETLKMGSWSRSCGY